MSNKVKTALEKAQQALEEAQLVAKEEGDDELVATLEQVSRPVRVAVQGRQTDTTGKPLPE